MGWLILFLGVFLNQALDVPNDWGDIQALGVAEQREAPVLIVGDNWTIGVWIGADETDTYHTLRRWDENGLGDKQRLSILTNFPQHHQVLPARRGQYHLLWLDSEPNEPLAGLRLWNVIINQTPASTRGAYILNDYPIYDFDAVSDDGGGAWLFFNSSPLAEPNLYVQYLDQQGRSRIPQYLAGSVNHPRALRLDDGTIRLFWHNPLTEQLMGAIFVDDQLMDVQAYLPYPTLGKMDILDDLQVAFDENWAYVFWNITRLAEELSETFYSFAPRDDLSRWTTPQPLRIGDQIGAWASPFSGETLSLALMIDNEIGIISMQAGAVIAVENVIALGEIRLVGKLQTAITPDGRLAISWSHLSPTGAIMNVIRERN